MSHPVVTQPPPLLGRFHSVVALYLAQVPLQAPPPPTAVAADGLFLSDEAFLTGLYRNLLGRDPDPQGFARHLGNLRRGTSREFVRRWFLGSDEYRARRDAPRADPPGATAPPAAPLSPAPAEVPAPVRPPAPATAAAAGRPLSLREYPGANPVGAHGIPNYLQSMDDVRFVLDLLGRAGARNTLLIVPFPSPAELRDVDRAFLEGARARGITVQLRLGWNHLGPGASMKPPHTGVDPELLRRYTAQVAGVLGHGPYIQIGNEPNLRGEWEDGQKPDPRAFARWWARHAGAVAAGGGFPGLPGMAAGAWDTPDGSARNEFGFYRAMLETVAGEAPRTLDRAWTAAHPYHMYADAGHPDYVEDVRWQLERFDAMNREILGRSLPVLVTESGYVDGENARRFDPGNARQAEDVARMKASLAERPDWLVVGTADWLISNRHGGNWKGIFGPDGEGTAWSQVLEAKKAAWEALTDSIRARV